MVTPAGSRQTPLRQRVLWNQLVAALGTPAGKQVLDCGGGTGSLAVPLAELGVHVTVVDVSVDALATLSRRAAEAGVDERVRPVQGDIESLADAVGSSTFDLVMAHGLLESVDDPRAAMASLVSAVRPGGQVSVVVANPVSAVLSRVVSGDLRSARALLADERTSTNGLANAGLEQLCTNAGLEVEQTHGLGIFTEFADGEDSDGMLAELEDLASARSPYREIAARRHVLARRPL